MLRVNVVACGCLVATRCINFIVQSNHTSIVTYPDVASKSGMAIFERCIMMTGVRFSATILLLPCQPILLMNNPHYGRTYPYLFLPLDPIALWS